jgi:hypothetical protein
MTTAVRSSRDIILRTEHWTQALSFYEKVLVLNLDTVASGR